MAAPASAVKLEGLNKGKRMKVKWTQLGLVFFLLLSLVMTGCFLWQYQLPKALPGKINTAGDALCQDTMSQIADEGYTIVAVR